MAIDQELSFPCGPLGFENPEALSADRLVEQAKCLPLTDGGLLTAELLSQALEDAPEHHEAQLLLERLHQISVPRWHFSMLGDEMRNAAYAKAIAAKVRPGDVVLDIGCGAGLTAMLAARAGAKHVYTCEQQPLIAEAAARVIAQNGLSDRITVIPKMSHNMAIGVDMPERADVVISEIVDTLLLGEGALASLEHAMRELAKPGARAVPEHGMLKAQLVTSDQLWNLWRPDAAEGFNLTAFHHFASLAQMTPNDLATLSLEELGPAEGLFAFDFARPSLKPARTSLHLECTTPGDIHAALVFFEMVLADGITLTNCLTSQGHWGRTAFLLNEPIYAMPGDLFRIAAQHDTAQLSLALLGLRPESEITLSRKGTKIPPGSMPDLCA